MGDPTGSEARGEDKLECNVLKRGPKNTQSTAGGSSYIGSLKSETGTPLLYRSLAKKKVLNSGPPFGVTT